MPGVDDAVDTQLRNIIEKHGKSLSEWLSLIAQSGKTRHNDIISFLKTEHSMSHGNANRLALIARESDGASIAKAAEASGVDPLTAMYDGKKAVLLPLHEALMAVIMQFGGDIEVVPKKGYVSLRRKKQFGMVQPTTATRIDVGLILKGEPGTERLAASASASDMFTHRVRVSSMADVDAQLTAWLRKAYDSAG
jgi:hypothetical protein